MGIKSYLLKFTEPYHVGWRRAKSLISSFTLQRALISVSYMVGLDGGRLEECRLSSMLPAIPGKGGCYHVVLPVPSLPMRFKASKLGLRWFTPGAARALTARADKLCDGSITLDVNPSSMGYELLLRERGSSMERLYIVNVVETEDGRKITLSDGVLATEAEVRTIRWDRVPVSLFESVRVWRNRIDRVTGAPDLFPVEGFKAIVDIAILIDCPHISHTVLHSLLELLGRLGVGGLRSIGWGRFTLVEGSLCGNYGEEVFKWRGRGYYVLLGSYHDRDGDVVEWSRSFINMDTIEGLAGPPYFEYRLPYIRLAGAGSILYLKSEPKPIIERVSDNGFEALIVLNPLMVHGGG
jgi:hypothetical protein